MLTKTMSPLALVRMEAVAAGAQDVLGQLTEADEPEDQPGDRNPQQQLGGRLLGLLFRCATTPSACSFSLVQLLPCREKVNK